ncbi:MAG: hypothetical protein AAB804_01330 [Patescibacteria group bacterium]
MARWTDITTKYWEMLEQAMRETGEFNLARLKHTKLRQAHYAGRAVVLPATDGYVPRSRIWAYAARLRTKDPLWQELAWFYVVADCAGNGILRSIVNQLVAEAPPEIKFWGISKKSAAMRVFGQHDLVAVTKYNMRDVEEWATRVGFRDRLPETALRMDPPDPKDGERWLFVQLHRL